MKSVIFLFDSLKAFSQVLGALILEHVSEIMVDTCNVSISRKNKYAAEYLKI